MLATTFFPFVGDNMEAFLFAFPFFCEWVSDFGTFEQLSETNLLKGLAGAGGSIDIDHAVKLGKISFNTLMTD